MRVDRWLGWAARGMAIIGAAGLVALVGVTVVAVIARYFLRDPIFGIEDVSSLALAVFVAAAIAFGARHNSHIAVNILSALGGRRVTRITDVIVRLLGAGIVGYAAFALFDKGRCGFDCGAFTPNLNYDHTPFYYLLGVAMALYAAILVAHLLIGLVHFSGDDPNETID